MFEVDEFVGQCLTAVRDPRPHSAVRELLERTMARHREVEAALPATDAEITTLHQSPELTVLKVVWPPGFVAPPHEHLMFAAIGIYGGQEDNTFYRRADRRVIQVGGRSLFTGEVAVLGDDVVHSVTNPRDSWTGAIHVYGGDLFAPVRKSWDPDTLLEAEGGFDPRQLDLRDDSRHDTRPPR